MQVDKWDIWEEQILDLLEKEGSLTGQEIIERLEIKLETFEDKFKFTELLKEIANRVK